MVKYKNLSIKNYIEKLYSLSDYTQKYYDVEIKLI